MIMKKLFKSRFVIVYNNLLSSQGKRVYSVSYDSIYLGSYFPSYGKFISPLECLCNMNNLTDRQNLISRICDYYKYDVDFSSYINTMLR